MPAMQRALFAVEQAGNQIVKNGVVQSTFRISQEVLSPASGGGNEEGLPA
jgi:hypothetical protein